MFKLQCTDTSENFRRHSLHIYLCIHPFIHLWGHSVSKYLLDNYYKPSSGDIIVSKSDRVTALWELESNVEGRH